MASLLIWKIIALLVGSPSAVIVARSIAQRFSTSWKAKADEVDYLRGEIKVQREEHRQAMAELRAKAEQAFRDLRVEVEARDKEHEELVARLHRRIDGLETERDRLMAELKIVSFDVETARRFVADATTTRKDKK